MAIIRPGPLAAAISGTVGGVTFTVHGQTTIARARGTFSPKNSRAALERRARMAAIRARWQTLTTLQRGAWITYGRTIQRRNRLGTLRRLTGYQAYIQFHISQMLIPITWRTFPPDGGRPKTPTSLTLAFTCGGPYTVTVTPAGWNLLDFLQIFLARTHKYGPLRTAHYFRYVGNIGLWFSQTGNKYLTTLPALGELSSGEEIHCRAQVLRADGGIGSMLTATTTVICP